jgi:uncharacterized protein YcbX
MEITQLWRYPVKSCGGMSLRAASIDDYGIVDDRLFVIAQTDGRRLTQRTVPKLNLISATLDDDKLRLRAPGAADLVVDRQHAEAAVSVELYDGPAPGVCMGAEAMGWLSEFLHKPCRLVQSREVFKRNMPAVAAHLFLREQRRYPDCAPLLLTSQASLDELNDRLATPIEMSRFRPNLVIDGLQPYAEDTLRRIRIGDVVLDYMGPCERCGITLIAPGTDRRGVEPLKTLRSYRFHPDRLESGLLFGAYFQPRGVGEVRCGSRVEIEQVGDPLSFEEE